MAARMRAAMSDRSPAVMIAVRRVLALVLVLAFLATIDSAQALSPPERTGWVTDEAGILDSDFEGVLIRRLKELQRRTGAEVIVVTLKSLQGASIEAWGDELGNSWNVGQSEGKDNGALLIVAPNDRKVRIAVGYGLGRRLPDSAAAAIIADRILPEFRAGDFAGGVDAGVTGIFEQVDRRPALPSPVADTSDVERSSAPAVTTPTRSPKQSKDLLAAITIVGVVLLGFCVVVLLILHGMSQINVQVSSPGAAKKDDNSGKDDDNDGGLGFWFDDQQSSSWWGRNGWSSPSWTARRRSQPTPLYTASPIAGSWGWSLGASSRSSGSLFSGGSRSVSSGSSRGSFRGGASGSW